MPSNEKLGKYEIGEALGSGTFAETFRARDSDLERDVALKILHPLLMTDRAFVIQFQREARTLARLRHPGILTIYEVVRINGRICLALELAEGGSLTDLLARRGRLSWVETLDLLGPICAALDYMHGQDVLHRDLKPSNILLRGDGQPLIADFGLSRNASQSLSMTSASRSMLGTPAYSAPELWNGKPSSPATDIYALACITYELLAGQRLFPAEAFAQEAAHTRGPRFLVDWRGDAPAALEKVLRKALAAQPEQRYQSARAFYNALRALAPAPRAQPTPAVEPAKQGLWLAMGGVVLALLVTLGVFALGRWPVTNGAQEPRANPTLGTQTTPGVTVTTAQTNVPATPPAAAPSAGGGALPSATPELGELPALGVLWRTLTHAAPVDGASWSPNGERIVTWQRDGLALIWDAASNQTLIELNGHTGLITTAHFSPDGELVVTASADSTARLWNLQGLIGVVANHSGPITSAVFSPDGQLILTASDDGTARLWNLQGSAVVTLIGHIGSVISAVFSPDGQLILTASDDGTARLWNLQGEELAVLRDDFPTKGPVLSAAFSLDGQAIFTTRENNAFRWNLEGLQQAHVMNTTRPVTGVYFHPDGKQILIDADGATWIEPIDADRFSAVGFGLVDERWIAAVSPSRTRPSFSPDGTLLMRGVGSELWVWSSDDRLLARITGHNEALTSASFSPDGSHMLSTSSDGTARIWFAKASS